MRRRRRRGQAGAETTTAAGCADVDQPAPVTTGERTAPADTLDPAQTWTLTFDTSCGTFVVTLDLESAPATDSVVGRPCRGRVLRRHGVPSHRARVRDPRWRPDPDGGGGPGYQTVDVPAEGAAYTHGVVAMAKAGPEPAGTAGSQFFVVTGADVGLPPDYAIVGEVTEGLDVVDLIGTLGDPATEQPTQAVVIESVTPRRAARSGRPPTERAFWSRKSASIGSIPTTGTSSSLIRGQSSRRRVRRIVARHPQPRSLCPQQIHTVRGLTIHRSGRSQSHHVDEHPPIARSSPPARRHGPARRPPCTRAGGLADDARLPREPHPRARRAPARGGAGMDRRGRAVRRRPRLRIGDGTTADEAWAHLRDDVEAGRTTITTRLRLLTR